MSGLLMFVLPLAATNILQLLFNAADVVIVGRFAGDLCLAAVSSTNHLVHLFTNLFTGMSVGVNVLIAHKIGEGSKNGISKAIHTSLLFGLMCGSFLTVFGLILTRTALVAINTPDNVLELAVLYLRIYFLSMPALIVYNFGAAVLRAKGDTKRPMYYLTLSGILNVILNVILVVVFRMTVDGVAIATVISEYISAVLVLRLLVLEEEEFRLDISKLKIDGDSLRNILYLGVPAGLQSTMFSISNVVIQSSINIFGSTMMSGCGAASSVESFANGIVQALATGTMTFVSQNAGAGKPDRIMKTIGYSILIGAVFCSSFLLMAVFFDRQLIAIYAPNPAVIDCGIIRLHYALGSYMLYTLLQLAASVLRGLKYSLIPTIAMMAGVCGIRLIWIAAVFSRFQTIENVMITYPLSWGITSAVLWAVTIIIFRKQHLQPEKGK
ncbi:MAG: MATE family efflux transporter [Eubacteriales bacterium]|nr:MATE family efflux transporter [Eubacteriales bacterium]